MICLALSPDPIPSFSACNIENLEIGPGDVYICMSKRLVSACVAVMKNSSKEIDSLDIL